MTDDELRDIRIRLAEEVAGRCNHIIHADDPVMALAVLLQVIGAELSRRQKEMLEDYAHSILSGTLRLKEELDKTAQSLFGQIHAGMNREIKEGVGLSMEAGSQKLQELLRVEFNRMLAAQRAENTAVRYAKQVAQVTLAVAVLSFLSGLLAFAMLIMR